MATSTTTTTPSSLMIRPHASSISVYTQDLNNPSLRCFNPNKPLSRTFSFYPLVLKSRARNSRSKCVHAHLRKEPNSRSSHLVVAAVAAEKEIVEASDDGSAENTVITKPKSKKGKAALPLKRDRV